MALYRCSSGGGTLTETTLWTNNSPTSSISSTTVTLSQSMSNFDFIKITWRKSTSDSAEQYSIFPIAYINNTSDSYRVAIGTIKSGSYSYVRSLYKASNTSIAIMGCYAMNNSSTSNTSLIPISISGMK